MPTLFDLVCPIWHLSQLHPSPYSMFGRLGKVNNIVNTFLLLLLSIKIQNCKQAFSRYRSEYRGAQDEAHVVQIKHKLPLGFTWSLGYRYPSILRSVLISRALNWWRIISLHASHARESDDCVCRRDSGMYGQPSSATTADRTYRSAAEPRLVKVLLILEMADNDVTLEKSFGGWFEIIFNFITFIWSYVSKSFPKCV